MTNYLFLLLKKFKTWREARVKESKQPLSRENAYVLSSIRKKGHYSDVTKEYRKFVLTSIEDNARIGHTYALIRHPSCTLPSDKESITDYLAELGYSICFLNSDVLLVSWKYTPNDFSLK